MMIVKNQVDSYLSSNFSETEPEWSPDETYMYGGEARDGHYIYKYSGSENTNTTWSPSHDTEESIGTGVVPSWVKVRPTNYYAMLDGKSTTKTSVDGGIDVVFEADGAASIALLGVRGQSVTLTLTNNITSEVEYTEVIGMMDESHIVDFYTYCFEGFDYASSLFRLFPVAFDSSIRVQIENDLDVSECGIVVIGSPYYVGDAMWDVDFNLTSYSVKNTDDFGNDSLIHRGSSYTVDYDIVIDSGRIMAVNRKAKEWDAIPLLLVADEAEDSKYENLISYGYWKTFRTVLSGPMKSQCYISWKEIS
jgi:hypothetical protein